MKKNLKKDLSSADQIIDQNIVLESKRKFIKKKTERMEINGGEFILEHIQDMGRQVQNPFIFP